MSMCACVVYVRIMYWQSHAVPNSPRLHSEPSCPNCLLCSNHPTSDTICCRCKSGSVIYAKWCSTTNISAAWLYRFNKLPANDYSTPADSVWQNRHETVKLCSCGWLRHSPSVVVDRSASTGSASASGTTWTGWTSASTCACVCVSESTTRCTRASPSCATCTARSCTTCSTRTSSSISRYCCLHVSPVQRVVKITPDLILLFILCTYNAQLQSIINNQSMTLFNSVYKIFYKTL